MPFSTPTTRWTALTTRDKTADSHFVYAVKTTRIYCRPSCAARLARRANVDFYAAGTDAEKAGFRPCKRCKPEVENLLDPQDVAVGKACEIIREAMCSAEYPNGRVGLNELAAKLQLTPSYLHKTFKVKMGVTPKAYGESLRQGQLDPILNSDKAGTGTSSSVHHDASCQGSSVPVSSNFFPSVDLDWDPNSTAATFDDYLDAVPEAYYPDGTSTSTGTLTVESTEDWSWLNTPEPVSEADAFLAAHEFAYGLRDPCLWDDALGAATMLELGSY